VNNDNSLKVSKIHDVYARLASSLILPVADFFRPLYERSVTLNPGDYYIPFTGVELSQEIALGSTLRFIPFKLSYPATHEYAVSFSESTSEYSLAWVANIRAQLRVKAKERFTLIPLMNRNILPMLKCIQLASGGVVLPFCVLEKPLEDEVNRKADFSKYPFKLSPMELIRGYMYQPTETSLSDLKWARNHGATFLKLCETSSSFLYAADSLQYFFKEDNDHTRILRLWSAIESIAATYSSSGKKAVNRVLDILVQGNCKSPSKEQIGRLYGIRSGIIHGRADYKENQFLALGATYDLLRAILKCIIEKHRKVEPEDPPD